MLWFTRVPLKLMPLAEVRAFTPPKAGRLLDTPMPKRRKRDHVAAVGRQLSHLGAADQVADLVGLRLELESIGLDGDRLCFAADREAEMSSFRV